MEKNLFIMGWETEKIIDGLPMVKPVCDIKGLPILFYTVEEAQSFIDHTMPHNWHYRICNLEEGINQVKKEKVIDKIDKYVKLLSFYRYSNEYDRFFGAIRVSFPELYDTLKSMSFHDANIAFEKEVEKQLIEEEKSCIQ